MFYQAPGFYWVGRAEQEPGGEAQCAASFPRPSVCGGEGGSPLIPVFNTCSLSPSTRGEMKHREVKLLTQAHAAGHGRNRIPKEGAWGGSLEGGTL